MCTSPARSAWALDEKAVEAVKQYRFKPAIDQKTGKAVPVLISFEVNFHLY